MPSLSHQTRKGHLTTATLTESAGVSYHFTLFSFDMFFVVIKSRAVGSIPVVRNLLFNFLIFGRCYDGSPVISNHPVHVDWLGNRDRFVLLILFRFSSPPPILLPFSLLSSPLTTPSNILCLGLLAWFCKLKYMVIIGRWSFSICITNKQKKRKAKV